MGVNFSKTRERHKGLELVIRSGPSISSISMEAPRVQDSEIRYRPLT